MTRFGADGFSATLTIPTMTLDMLPCTYHIEVNGNLAHNGVPTGLSSIRVDMPNEESAPNTAPLMATPRRNKRPSISWGRG